MILRDVEHVWNGTCFGEGMLNGGIFGYLRQKVPNWLYSEAAVESVI